MRTLLLVILIALFIGNSLPLTAQDVPSDAPYLYYFDDYLNAFVIERADGTDSRILGEGLMPSNVNSLTGAGWSPSGEWFAWVGYFSGGYNPTTDFIPYAVKVNGQERLTVLDQFNEAWMEWSPVDDILAVVGTIGDVYTDPNYNNVERITVRMALVDVTSDRIISFQDREGWQGDHTYWEEPGITWTQDGEQVIFAYEDKLASASEPMIYQVFALDGTIEEYTFSASSMASDSGEILHLADNQLLLQDLSTSQAITIEGLPAYDHLPAIDSIEWDVSQQYALVITPGQVWLIDRANKQVKTFAVNSMQYQNSAIWLPDKSQFGLHENNGGLYLVEPETGQTRNLISSVVSWQWLDSTHLQAVIERFNTGSYGHDNVYYDVSTSRETIVSTYYPAYFSTDGRYLAAPNVGLTLHDLGEGQTMVLRPHEGKHPLSNPAGIVSWDSASSWVLYALNGVMDGAYTAWSIVDKTGNQYRDLTDCRGSLCANWLPQHVKVEPLPLAPPHQLTPVWTLKTQDYIAALAWSPDSRWLASANGYFLSRWMWTSIWDVAAQAIKTTWVHGARSSPDHQLEWELRADGTYQALLYPVSFTGMGRLFSPDRSRYIDLGQSGTGDLALYENATDQILHDFPMTQLHTSSSFNAAGDLIAFAGNSGYVDIWDAETGERRGRLPIRGNAVAFSPDGRWLAVGSSWDILIFDMAQVLEFIRQ